MKDKIKTVSGYGRIFPKERDTDESHIFKTEESCQASSYFPTIMHKWKKEN